MGQEGRNPGIPEDVDEKLERAAHHEAGHIVIAAVEELRLRPEGLAVDTRGGGMACYGKRPDGSDLSLRRIIVATYAGVYAEKRLCDERSYRPPDADRLWQFGDWDEAHKRLCEISAESLSNGTADATKAELQSRSEQLVEQNWLTVKALAANLLAKDLEPLKLLKSGDKWSDETTARYLAGHEVVGMLDRYGIAAVCDPDC